MSYLFSHDGNDYKYTRMLQEASNSMNDSFIELAKMGLRKSKDEVLRNVSLSYIVELDNLTEDDVLIGLNDEHDIVLLEAIEASEYFDTDKVTNAIIRTIKENSDESVVSTAIISLGFKNIEIEEYYKYISPKLMTSPLVKSAISFHIAFNHDDVLSFFQFINSENYLVRMMVANLSDCFIETDFSENILNLLIERNKIEDFVAIKEILSSRIKQYRNN